MDFFKGIGDFFAGIFGGNKNDDEERKRREREEAAKRQEAASARQRQAATPQRPSRQQFTSPFQNVESLTKPLQAPKATPTVTQLDEAKRKRAMLDEITRTGKPPAVNINAPKLTEDDIKGALKKRVENQAGGTAYERAVDAVPISLQKMVGGLISTPERIIRSGAQLADKAITGVDQDYSAKEKNTGLRRFLYGGSEPVTTYQTEGEDFNKFIRGDGSNDIRSAAANVLPATLIAVGLAALDVGGIGIAGAIKNVSRDGMKAAVNAVTNTAEKQLGRRLTEKEARDLAERTERSIAEEIAKETPPAPARQAGDAIGDATDIIGRDATQTPQVPRPTQTKEEVARSYQDTFNRITADPNLTPQQKVEFAAEAKARHAEMLKQIDDSAAAQTQVVADQAKAVEQAQVAREAEVANLQEAQTARVTPPEGAVGDVPSTAVARVEEKMNDAYASDEAFRQAQDARVAERTQNPITRMFDTFKRNVVDPRTVQQRLDNQEFKRLKKEGLIPKGQRELSPEQSIAIQQGRIENPNRAAEVRGRAKYRVGNEEYSLNDIIKFYGKEDGDKARAFENYRIYKDELERLMNGGENTVGVDPKLMATYVQQYERLNPKAVAHNAALRQISLDALKAKRDARIDAPELFDNSAKFEYYNPRQAVDPEDLIRPKMSGGVRSGAKGTQTRAETAGGVVRSPLSLFKDRNVEVERALATQRRDMIIRDRSRAGALPGATEIVDADVAIAHRQAIRNMRDLSEQIKSLQTVKKGAKREAKQQAVVDKAKTDAISLVKEYLRTQSAGETGVAFANNIKDKEALDLFNVITEAGEVNAKRLVNKISKDSGVPSEQTKDFITGLSQEIKDARSSRTDAFNEMVGTTQNLERGTQTITYKLDGETGKIEIPADLANELSKANEARVNSPIEAVAQGIANVQKLTWTGALSPVFKTFNVLVKNPLLAYRNADGLSGVDPRALAAGIGDLFRVPGMRRFREEMLKRGASYENALQTKNIYSSTADDIAARANIISYFNRNPISTLQDVWKTLNQALAAPDNAQRTAVAYGAYLRARRLGLDEDAALSIASQAPAKVYGDFDRISRLAQNAEIILPYSGAIQAGARALARASKTKPIETALKDATFLATAAGFTAYSLGNATQYYDDMIEKGQEYLLDNNFTIVLPGAQPDSEGNWTGVIHIPLTPDLRPYNRATWRSVYDNAKGEGLDPGLIAGELFNQFTGDVSNSIYDDSRVGADGNVLNGFLSGSPIGTAMKIGAGVDPRTGEQLTDEYTSRLPRAEQANNYTSDTAKALSESFGGVLTPLQVDKFLDQMGGLGDTIQNREDSEGKTDPLGQFFNFGKPLEPGRSLTEKGRAGKQFYEDLDAVKSTITDEKTFNAFEALHSKKAEDAPENLLTSAAKAASFMSYAGDGTFTTTPLFEAEKKLDALNRARGQMGNPIFDLAPQELQKVLTYRSGKIYNAAKQNYTKMGEGAFTSLGLDNKWYSDFRKAETNYYNAVLPDEAKSDEIATFSGKKKPALSPAQEAIETQYYNLPPKSQERKDFLAKHSWLKDWWAESNEFTDEERRALGFNEVEKYEDKKGDGGGGGKRGSYIELNRILNLGDNVKRLEALTPQQVEALAPLLRKLFAPRRGGRATVTIGAKASGNPPS